MTEYEERIKTLTADMEDWVEGRRSWTNILPDTTAAGHAAAAVMDAQEVIKRSTAIQAYVAQCMTLMKLLDAYKERDRLRAFWDEMRAFRDWANVQFPNSTPQSKAHHLAKEAHELANNPSDPEEMADVLGLFAHLADWDGVDLAGALRAKRLINQSRQWGTPDENGVIEHLRDAKRKDEGGTLMEPERIAEKTYQMELIHGVEGDCISLNNYRIAGPKPWGGGQVTRAWRVSVADLQRAIPELAAEATWLREALP